jgi:hypothetical protein
MEMDLTHETYAEQETARFGLRHPVADDHATAQQLVAVALHVGHHGVFRRVEDDLVHGIRVPVHLEERTRRELEQRGFTIEEGDEQ